MCAFSRAWWGFRLCLLRHSFIVHPARLRCVWFFAPPWAVSQWAWSVRPWNPERKTWGSRCLKHWQYIENCIHIHIYIYIPIHCIILLLEYFNAFRGLKLFEHVRRLYIYIYTYIYILSQSDWTSDPERDWLLGHPKRLPELEGCSNIGKQSEKKQLDN